MSGHAGPDKHAVPRQELNARLRRLRSALEREKVDGALISDRANSCYYSGFTCSNSVLLVTPHEARFLTDFRYLERADREVTTLEVARMTQDGVGELDDVIRKSGVRSIAFESSVSYAQVQRYRKAVGRRARLVEKNAMFSSVRAVKSAREVELIAANQRLNGRFFTELIDWIRPGMSEARVRRELLGRMLDRGVEEAFESIIAAGTNSSLPHAVSGSGKIRKGGYLLVDMGIKEHAYHSDMTRTVGVGKVSPRHREIYDIVLEAQARALDTIRAGAPGIQVDAAAREFIKSAGYGGQFGHGLGHGVGLEIHEAPALNPRSKQVLEAGMVVTVEPGIYIPGFGGVRIEDLVVVTQTGYRNLTTTPKMFREI